MAKKKENSNGLPESVSKSAKKQTPSSKKNITKKNLQLENLISEFSAALIDTPEENLEGEINNWLKKIVELLKVDRFVVNEYLDDKKIIHPLWYYTVPEVDVLPVIPDYRSSEDAFRELKKDIIIKVEEIPEDLPQSFRGRLIERENTKSFIIVPLSIGGNIFGSLLFSSFRKRRKWSDDLVRKIKLIGEIIASSILRIRSYKNFIQESERRKILEERYDLVLKNANVGFWITDLDKNIIYVNDEYCRMTGYSSDEILSMKITDLALPSDPERTDRITKDVERTGAVHHEATHRTKDGGIIELDVSSTVIEPEKILFSFMRDVTELNKTRKEQEERFRFEELVSEFSATLLNRKPDDIGEELNLLIKKFVEFFRVDRGVIGEYTKDPSTVKILMSYTAGDAPAKPLEESYPITDSLMQEYEKGIIISAEKIDDDLPLELREWSQREDIKSYIVIPLASENQVIGNITLASHRQERNWSDDLVNRIKLIGEIVANAIIRMRSQKSLLEEVERREQLEETYSSVIKNANLGFMTIDLSEYSIIDVNDEYCRMSGYSREELINKKTWEIDASMDPDKIINETELTIRQGAIHFFTTNKRKDGSLFDVEISSNLFAKDSNVVYSFIRDITDINRTHKELEERLEFEELVSDFSAALITPDEVQGELNSWLKRFVEFLEVDRGVVIEYLDDLRTVQVMMQYAVPEVQIEPLGSTYIIPEGEIEEFQKGLYVRAEKIPDDLPETVRDGFIEEENTKSVVIVPLSIGSKIIGSLTFANYRKERKWSDDIVRRIKLIGEIIANAILRKRSRDALIEEVNRRKMLEEKYASILKYASVGFMITDLTDFSVIDVNDEYCRMSGYNRDELISKKVWELDASQNPDKVRKEKTSLMEQDGVMHLETSHIRKDGSVIDVEVSGNVFEKDNIVCTFIRDVTDLKKAQKEQEERLSFEELVSEFSAALINIEPDEIKDELEKWIRKIVDLLDVDRGIVHEYVDEQKITQVLMHYTVPDVNLSTENMRPTPDGLVNDLEKGGVIRIEKIPEDLPQSLRGGIVEKHNTRSLVVVPLLTGNKVFGNLSLASYRKEREWSDDLIRRIKLLGEIIGNAVLRMRSHESLLKETEQREALEERYSSIIKNANVGFWISDQYYKILAVNDEYCRMSGYSRDELLNMRIPDVDISMTEEKPPMNLEEFQSITAAHHEVIHRKKDGTHIELDISSNRLEKENLRFSFMRDVTELNQTRREREIRLRFEELVSEFSAALINIKIDDLVEELKKWIIKFVDFLEIDRGVINEYDYDKNTMKALVNYTDPHAVAETSPHDTALRTPDAIMNEFKKGAMIRAEKIPDDLQPVFLGWIIEKHNTKSLAVVPLVSESQIIGNLTLASYRKGRKWSDDIFSRIKLIGEIIANAILRLRAHEALLEEMERRHMLEERYTSIIKTANVGFTITDMSANILEVNDAYCEMSGYSRDELLGMKLYQLDASGDPDKVDKDKHGIYKTGAFHHETSHIRKDGKVINVLISANLLKNEGIICSFYRDVTELKITREDLEERLKFEELTSEFSAALINLKLDNIDEELTPWLKKYMEFFEVERGIINEYQYDDRMVNVIATYTVPGVNIPSTKKIEKVPESIMERLAQGTVLRVERIPEDLPSIFNEGVIRNHNTKSLVIVPLSAENQIIGNLTLATYTKEHKWSDEFLRRVRLTGEIIANAILRKRSSDTLIEEMKSRHMLEKKYTSIIKNASVGFTISDHNQNILDANDEYCRMSGYTYDELIKMKISDIDLSASPGKVDHDMDLTVDGGLYHHQSRHVRKDGSIVDVEINSQYSESEGFFFSFIRDVTELNKARREIEERLKFEELVSEFSAALINIEPDKIKNELENWIGKIVDLLDVDMGIVNEYINDQKNILTFFQYTVPGLSVPVNKIRKIQPGFISLLEKGVVRAEKIPEDLPQPLREGIVEEHRTKSLIVAPLLTGNRVFGNLTFACYRKEHLWPDELVRRIRLVGEIIGNAILRLRSYEILNQARKELEERLQFEELVSDFSAALVNIKTDSISEELHKWIIKFVGFLEVDRCIINEFKHDEKAVNALVTYSGPDVDAPPHENYHAIPDKMMTELEKGIVIRAEKIPEDLPQAFRGWMIEEHNTRSLVTVPLSAGNQVIGNLTFTNYREERKWSDELVRRIKLIGEIIANAILRKRSSDALIAEMERRRQLEEMYTSIIKNANVGFMISDMNQNIMVVNDEYCSMSGFSRAELTKMKISDIDYSEDAEKVDEGSALTVQKGLLFHQARHIKKDGSIYDVEVNSKFMDGERIVFSFIRDVTELNKARRELEERLKFEELVSEFSASLINVKIANIKNELNVWLERFARFLNVDKYALGEFEDDYKLYRFISTYINPELDPQPPVFPSKPVPPHGFTEFLRKVDTVILENVDRDGSMLPESLMQRLKEDGTKSALIFPLVAGDILLGSMLISSITREKKWPQHLVRELKLVAEIFANALMRDKRDLELDNYRKDLEKMVDERTAELKNAQKELVLSEKMATLGRLTATVSHELRNPLGTIRTSVFSVQRRLKEQDGKVLSALDRADRNIKRCDLIIDELLNYSRVHDLKLESTPIDTWISEVLEETNPPEGVSLNKELNANTVVNMDQERFRRSIVNIMTNAYQSIQEKDAEEQGYVRVITRKDIEKVTIEISDNGVGFDMENKDKLFEPLYSTKTFGVGLGIPITRQIIEQHGWSLDITGESQKGASVIITIPI